MQAKAPAGRYMCRKRGTPETKAPAGRDVYGAWILGIF